MRTHRVQHTQQDGEALGQRRAVFGAVGHLGRFQRVQHFHHGGHHRVVLHALVIVVGLTQRGVNLEAQLFAGGTGGSQLRSGNAGAQGGLVLDAKVPDAAQEAVAALDRRIVPLQRQFGRRGEHGVQARRIGTIPVDQRLRIHAVVLGLGHGAHALVIDRGAGRQLAVGTGHSLVQLRADDLAFVVQHMLDIARPEIFLGALGGTAAVDVVEHHALRQQALEGLVAIDQAHVAHHLGPEARIQQVQDGVLDTADVLVHRHPVVGARIDHGGVVLRTGVAHEVPGTVHEGVHGVGLAARRLAALRTGDAGVEALVLVQRVAGTVRDAVIRQHHRQVLLGHRHRAAAVAVDDRDRRAPVALAADAPVTQAPGGLFLAQTQCRQLGRHLVYRIGAGQAAELVGVDGDALGLVGVPLLPAREIVVLGTEHIHHLLDRNAVLQGKGEIALVMAGHAHHGAIAITHQHVVADPQRH